LPVESARNVLLFSRRVIRMGWGQTGRT
jgi:hypothetical protein